METNNNRKYLLAEFLFFLATIICSVILIVLSYKITNHNIKSLLYVSIVILGIISYNSFKSFKKELENQ